jgi:outer membrane protein OmpA-like peptidoglycan-associated protein
MYKIKGFLLLGFAFLNNHDVLCGQQEIFDTVFVIQKQDVLFQSDSFLLLPNNHVQLKTFVRKDSVYFFRLTGHTDSDGGNDYNLKLSEKRASSVAMFLIDSLHIRPDRITLRYEGESKPIATNSNFIGKASNRRVTVEQVLSLKMRRLHGRLLSDSHEPVEKGIVFIQSRYYRDSTFADNLGRFSIAVPEKGFVRLHATGKNHFYLDSLLKVHQGIESDSLLITLPYLRVDQRYNLPEMLFVGNQDVLLERSMSSLSALTQTMVNSDVCAIIEGHVNRPNQIPQKPGTFSFTLSVARAQKIKNHLITRGVDSMRLNPIGYSNWYMKYPYAKTEMDQELNRRVEMVIVNCDSLFNFTQNDVMVPEKIGTNKRLLKGRN